MLCLDTKAQQTAFTIPSLCNSCKIENSALLEEVFSKSKLFTVKSVDVDDKPVSIYELFQGNRLFLLFAVLVYAAEYGKYEENYTGYCVDGSYYFA